MPNLKTLEINLKVHPMFQYLHRENASIRQLLVTNTLPKLENLITLKMTCLSTILWNELLEANSHVRSISVDAHDNYNRVGCVPDYLTTMEFGNLQELAVTLLNEDLYTFKSVAWPALKALNIRWQFGEIDSVFRTISEAKFAPTLKRLVVSHCHPETKKEECDIYVETMLELPQLESFKMIVPISIENYVEDVDFLFLGCPSLVNLELEMRVPAELNEYYVHYKLSSMWERDANTTPIIPFVKYENTKELLESNIWTLFPKLKCVKIVWEVKSPNYRLRTACSNCG